MLSQSAPYDFSSKPKPVGVRRKYRPAEDDDIPYTNNIMADKRVVRGNTYAMNKFASQTAPLPNERHAFGRAMDASGPPAARSGPLVPETDEPSVPRGDDSIFAIKAQLGKKSEPLDLTPYLVEQDKGPVPVKTVDTQTAEFADRPPTPPFRPAKTGVDAATQIEPGGGGPWDFDAECAPLVAVLCAKTLEQAALEVAQEAELEALKQQMGAFLRAEEEERRRVEELERRQREEWEAKERAAGAARARRAQELRTRRKVLAGAVLRELLPGVRERMCQDLAAHPSWERPERRAARCEFLPWVWGEVGAALARRAAARGALDALLGPGGGGVGALAEARRGRRAAALAARRAREEEERRQRELILRVFIDGASLGLPVDEETGAAPTLGPIELNKERSIAEIEQDIQAYFADQGIEVEIPEGGFITIAYDGIALDRDQSIVAQNIPMDGKLQVIINSSNKEDGSGEGDDAAEGDGEDDN